MAFDASASFSASASASASLGGASNTAPSGSGGGTGTKPAEVPENLLAPLLAFRFHVRFKKDGSEVAICSGAFSDCTGLEATMEPRVIKAGGSNYGAAQRAGTVSFATVVLKRGMTATRDLWNWFQLVNGGAYSYRLSAEIDVQDAAGKAVITWGLERCLPVKFKAADLNAKGTEVGIEELHLAHEGLRLIAG